MITLDDIQEAGGGKKYETYVSLCCPFHNDTHPSLIAHEDGFKCLSCGEWGKLDKLLAKLKNAPPPRMPFSRLPWRRWLDGKSVRDFAIECHENLIDFPQQAIYLKKRKINHLIEKMKLGWIDGYYTFPIFSPERHIVGIIARVGESIQEVTELRYITPPKDIQEPMLYVPSWKRVLQSDYLYAVYGIIDALIFYSIGEPVVTWSTGKNLPAEALAQFRKRIIVVPDKGEEKDAFRLIINLGWRGTKKFLDYPEGMKDPSDIYQHQGAEALSLA